MKKIVIGVLIMVTVLLVVRSQFTTKKNSMPLQINNLPTKLITNHSPLPTNHSQNIFVPYWSGYISTSDVSKYDTFYYFGVSPTSSGALNTDLGLQNISIVKNIPQKQKKLVLRMLDASITEVILGDNDVQKKLSIQLKAILEKKEFSGIVLDVEVPFTLQADKKKQITKFVQLICTEIKSDYKTCDILVYGDFHYRNRPYDLKALGEVVDTILLMAYDFHKAGGEQGPNFPFDSGSQNSPSLRASPSNTNYGYDFKQMILDATTLVPKQKIEVVFGMYGYDWTLNEQGIPLKSAEALSVNEIRQRVAQSSNRQNNENDTRYALHVSQNAAMEKSIQYIDEAGRSHVIWYEDEESVAIKTKYLQEQGISQVSFWAYSYF